MAIRIIVKIDALPGKGSEMAQAWLSRLAEVQQEPGCQQYEVFRSVQRPDSLILLELWDSAESLEVHGKLNGTREPIRPDLRGERIPSERFEF